MPTTRIWCLAVIGNWLRFVAAAGLKLSASSWIKTWRETPIFVRLVIAQICSNWSTALVYDFFRHLIARRSERLL
jgi:hypothetical protein